MYILEDANIDGGYKGCTILMSISERFVCEDGPPK